MKTAMKKTSVFILLLIVFKCLLYAIALGNEDLLVSAVMPTRDREPLVQFAIDQLSRQDLPTNIKLELVIVDQSVDCQQRLDTPPDRRSFGVLVDVRRLCASPALAVGTMRNMAVEEVKGSIVVHVDDDDLYRADRVMVQLAPVLAGQADLTALPFAKLLHTDTCTVTDFEPAPVDPTNEDEVDDEIVYAPHFGSLLYRRAVWRASHDVAFPDQSSLGEDQEFVERALDQGFVFKLAGYNMSAESSHKQSLPDTDVMLHVRHGSNANRHLTPEAIAQMRNVPPPPWALASYLESFCNLAIRVTTNQDIDQKREL